MDTVNKSCSIFTLLGGTCTAQVAAAPGRSTQRKVRPVTRDGFVRPSPARQEEEAFSWWATNSPLPLFPPSPSIVVPRAAPEPPPSRVASRGTRCDDSAAAPITRRPHAGPSEVYGLPDETLAKLRQLAGPEGASPDLRSLLIDAVDQMLARAGEPGATPRSSRRRQRGTKQAMLGNGNPTPGSLCSWAVLPDPVVRSIHQLLEATAPGHVRASLLQVCKGWAAQFSAALDEAPPGRGTHNRRCAWQLCARGPRPQGSAAGFGGLRALSLGVNRLPDPRLPALLASLPHLEALDLHFPPCYQPTSTSHLRALSGLRIPSLGLHFRCPMLSPIQLQALQRIPNLHRLAFKVV